MKKHIIPLIAALSLFSAPGADAMRGEEIQVNVIVCGKTVEFEDQKPVIINGRALLPIRGAMEALGKDVSWDDGARRAVISDSSTAVSLSIGGNIMNITKADGSEEEIMLDTAPIILNNRTCLPIRAVAEAFGASVGWDDTTKTVSITLTEDLDD